MSNEAEAVRLLMSIDTTLKQLLGVSIERMHRATGQKPAAAQGSGAKSGAVASDQDLDSQHGNEEIKFNPRDWTGASMKGRLMSECPADFLDIFAEACDFFADRKEEAKEMDDKGRPKWTWDRKRAARARGWALRVRAGKVPRNHDDDSGADEPPPNF